MEILYDTLLYIAINKNEKVMTERIYGRSLYPDEDMKHYCDIKRSVQELPDILIPLCYCTPSGHACYLLSLVTRYIKNSVNFDCSVLCNHIYADPKLLPDFLEYVFPELHDTDKKILLSEDIYSISRTYAKLFDEYSIPKDLIHQFTVFTAAYRSAVYDVARAVSMVYPHIKALHEREAKSKETIRKSAEADRDALDRIYKLSPVIPLRCHVSLLNPWAMCQNTVQDKYCFITGQRYNECFQMERVTLENFHTTVKGRTAWVIFNEMIDRDICVNNIIEKYGFSATGVYEMFDRLLTKGIISVSYRINRENYYTINLQYLCSLIVDIDQIREKIQRRRRSGSHA